MNESKIGAFSFRFSQEDIDVQFQYKVSQFKFADRVQSVTLQIVAHGIVLFPPTLIPCEVNCVPSQVVPGVIFILALVTSFL